MSELNELKGGHGKLTMTIEIKRSATGETEVHELVGTAHIVDKETEVKEDGSNT